MFILRQHWMSFTTVLWSARWSHFPPDFYIIFVLLQKWLSVELSLIGNLSSLALQLTNMRPQTGNRGKKMKGAEKDWSTSRPKILVVDAIRLLKVITTNLSEWLKLRIISSYFNNFLLLTISTVKNGYNIQL